MKLPYIAAVAAFAAAVVAGCGGGGGGSAVAPSVVTPTGAASPTSAPASTAVQKVTLSIIIPKGVKTAQTLRGKQYIPSNTAAMTLTLISVNGVTTSGTVQGPFNLTAPSSTNKNPACTVVTAGTACTFSITAPAGSDIFTATTYSDAAATQLLGSGSVAFSVVTNATNTANLTLAGPVASITLFTSTLALNNGNPLAPTPQPSDYDESYMRLTGGAQQRATAGRKAPGGATRAPATSLRAGQGTRTALSVVTPAPLPSAVTSSRIFVIALDAAGNQIINPTTFDITVSIALSLNGLVPGAVSLNVAYAGLSQQDTGTSSTTTDGGTINVYSPSDQVTLTMGSATASGTFSPSLVANYTPQGGTAQTSPALIYAVNANPPGPLYGLSVTAGSFYTGVPAAITIVATNGGNGPTYANTEVAGEVDNGTIVNFGSTNTAFWNCATTYSYPPYYTGFTCTAVAGTIAANTTAPPITLNATSTDATIYTYVAFEDSYNYFEADDSFSVNSGPTPSPSPSPSPAPALTLSLGAVQNPYGYFNATEPQTLQNIVYNNGNAGTVGTVTVTDTLPSGVTYTGVVNSPGWSCGASGQVVTCTTSSTIPAGSSSEVDISVTPAWSTEDTSITMIGLASGGGSPTNSQQTLTLGVQTPLQIYHIQFPSPAYLTNNSDQLATIDFGPPNNGNQGFFTFYNYSVSNRTVSIASSTCTDNSLIDYTFLSGYFPLTVVPGGQDVQLDQKGTGPGSCSITFQTETGAMTTLNIQVEQTSIIVNGRKRAK